MEQKTMIIIGAIVLALLILIAWPIGMYNGLVRAEERVDGQWANVESSYQRRMDLIPNLVSTVQGAGDFEQETLTQVAQIRSDAIAAQNGFAQSNSIEGQVQAAQQGEAALGRLLAIVENYPQITATENYRDLQAQLEGTENRINVERSRYNDEARDYNAKLRTFPRVIIANAFGFERKPFFEASSGAEEAPQVEFN